MGRLAGVLFALMAIRVFTWWKGRHSVPPILVLMVSFNVSPSNLIDIANKKARDSTIYFSM
jgi:hypothetical protein